MYVFMRTKYKLNFLKIRNHCIGTEFVQSDKYLVGRKYLCEVPNFAKTNFYTKLPLDSLLVAKYEQLILLGLRETPRQYIICIGNQRKFQIEDAAIFTNN